MGIRKNEANYLCRLCIVSLPSLVSPTMDLGLATMDLAPISALDLGLATMDLSLALATSHVLALTQITTLDLETLPDQVPVLATSLDLALTQITTLDLAQDLALGENFSQ